MTYNAKEKDVGPNYLLFDGNLSTDFKGNTGWGLRSEYNMRWLNSLGGELRTDVQLGAPNVVGVEFYQPLDLHQTFFIAPSLAAHQQLQYLYSNDAIAAQLDSRSWGGQLDVGAAFGSWGEWRFGMLRSSFDGRLNVSYPGVPNPGRSELGGLTTRFIYDTQDLRLFPTSGSYGSISGYYSTTSLGASQDYNIASINWQTAFTSSRRNVWTAIVRAGSDFGSHAPYYDQFGEGGLFNFSGYQINQLIGREYVFGAMQYRRAISYLTESLGTAVYLGATVEAGNVYQRLDGAPSTGALIGGSLFVGIRSKLGPVYFAYGQSEGGRHALYLYLGSAVQPSGQFR